MSFLSLDCSQNHSSLTVFISEGKRVFHVSILSLVRSGNGYASGWMSYGQASIYRPRHTYYITVLFFVCTYVRMTLAGSMGSNSCEVPQVSHWCVRVHQYHCPDFVVAPASAGGVLLTGVVSWAHVVECAWDRAVQVPGAISEDPDLPIGPVDGCNCCKTCTWIPCRSIILRFLPSQWIRWCQPLQGASGHSSSHPFPINDQIPGPALVYQPVAYKCLQ